MCVRVSGRGFRVERKMKCSSSIWQQKRLLQGTLLGKKGIKPHVQLPDPFGPAHTAHPNPPKNTARSYVFS